jgi:hypothetical protein
LRIGLGGDPDGFPEKKAGPFSGYNPVVDTWDGKYLMYVFAVVNVVTAALHANLVDSPKDAKTKTGKSKTRRLQEAFAAHPRHGGRMYPAATHRRVLLLIDNAPWHAGEGGGRHESRIRTWSGSGCPATARR